MGILDKINKGKDKPENKDEKKPVAKKAAAKKPAAKKDAAKPAAKKADSKKTETKKAAPKGNTRKKVVTGSASRLVVRPVFTEKAEMLSAAGKYTFIVSKDANKVEITRAINELYGVKPVSVQMMIQKGKAVRFGRRTGKRKDEKKAIVTLKKGDTITVMEGV